MTDPETDSTESSPPPFALRGLDHIVLRTPRPAALMAFYHRVLGAHLERHLEEEGLYQLRAGHSLIDIVDTARPLGLLGGDAPSGQAPNLDHFCLQIEPWDESALLPHLAARGVACPPVARRYGADGFGPSLYIRDPDGNTVELKGPPEGASRPASDVEKR